MKTHIIPDVSHSLLDEAKKYLRELLCVKAKLEFVSEENLEQPIASHKPTTGKTSGWLFKDQNTNKEFKLIALITETLQPRQVDGLIFRLHSQTQTPFSDLIYPLVIAPSLSPRVTARLEAEQIAWLDFGGNAHLDLGSKLIHIEGKPVPKEFRERPQQKSLYSPKASRLLRILLQGPLRPHKVEELAGAAGVSLGLVSKVRKVLLDQDLAEDSKEGIRIKGAIGARTILKDWLLEDDFSRRTEVREYSVLAPDLTLAGNLNQFCAAENSRSDAAPLFTQNFGAWLRAPHNVPTTVSAYLERFPDEEELSESLKARRVQAGAGNLRILCHDDYEAIEIGRQKIKKFPEFSSVSDLQLFLDLHGGETNGPEQARLLQALEDFSGGWV